MTFIPAETDVSFSKEIKNKRLRIKIGRIFELTAENPKEIAELNSLPPVILKLPEAANEELNLLLATTVTVFDSTVPEEYESSITYPQMLKNYALAGCGNQIEFTYRLGNTPGFEYRCIDTATVN